MTERNQTTMVQQQTPLDSGSEALRELRAQARHAYERLGTPHIKAEEFNYVRTSEISPFLLPAASLATVASCHPSVEEVQKHILPESRQSYLVLVDGQYQESLSRPPKGLEINPVATLGEAEAASMLAPFLLMEEEDALSALAIAQCEHPLHLSVPAKWNSPTPIQVLAYAASPAPRTDIALMLTAGSLSESRFTFLTAGPEAMPESKRMDNISIRFDIEEGASLRWQQAERALDDTLHLCKLNGRLARDSRFSALSASPGSHLTRRVFTFALAGEGVDLELKSVTAAAGQRQSHSLVQINHLAPHCTSRQQFKNVVAEKSRSSVNGTIHVAKAAQQTNASQLINNLMLSDDAHADTKPRLMIFADDVKCSHGATVGRLDAEQIFYLRARGLTAEQARTYLTVAFIEEVLESAHSPSLRALLESSLIGPLMPHLAHAKKER